MRKVRICASNIWVTSNDYLGFAHPVFWPDVIDFAPNLQQVLSLIGHFLFFYQGREYLMRKVRICAPNIWVTSNENLGFAHPVFWPYVIGCAPNLQQILPPLKLILFTREP